MIKNSILSATVSAWVALAVSSLPVRAELKPEEIYAAVLPSTVSLEVENVAGRHFVGSAFLAAGNGLAVTAWHVIYDARHVEARFADGRRVKVLGVVDKNLPLDLALIKLETGGRPRVKLHPGTPRIGSRVYVVGSPRGFAFSIGDGLLSQIREVDGVRYYQLSCPISPGDSGGAVLNDRAEVIGVVSWRKADAENLGFAIPAPAIARLNAALPVVAWVDTPRPASPPAPGSDPAPFVRAAAAASEPGVTNTFSDLLHYLSARTGEPVTVTIQDKRGNESRFSFQVPGHAGK